MFGKVLKNEFKKFFNLKTVLAAIISAAAVFTVLQIVFFANFASLDKRDKLKPEAAKAYYEKRLEEEKEKLAHSEEIIERHKDDPEFDMDYELKFRDERLSYVNFYELILKEELFEGVILHNDYGYTKYEQEPFDVDIKGRGQGNYLSNGSLGVFFIGIAVCVLGVYTIGKEKQSGNIKNLYTSPARRGYFIAGKLLVIAVLGAISITVYCLLEMCAVGYALGPDRILVYDSVTTWRSVSVYAYIFKQCVAALPHILLAGAFGVLLGTLFRNGIGGSLIGVSVLLALFVMQLVCSVMVREGFIAEWIPIAAGAYGYYFQLGKYVLSDLAIVIGSGLLYTSVVAAAGIVTAERMQIKK